MKHVNFLIIFAFCCSQNVFANSDIVNKKNTIYQVKLAECVALEKSKSPLTNKDVQGLSLHVLSKGLFYLKEKRLADCSMKQELDALAEYIALSTTSEQLTKAKLSNQFLSVWLVDLIKNYNELTNKEKHTLNMKIKNKSLEINFLELFDAVEKNVVE